MERIKSGIIGLDEIIGGGIPKGKLVLLTGTTGSGKTIFCTQYVYSGAKEYNEPGVYLSFGESPDSIRKNALNFGWDLKPLELQNKFSFVKHDPYHIEDVVDILESKIREIGAKRVVIDPISALELYIKNKAELGRIIFNLSLDLNKLNCTTILASEITHGIEEFVSDIIIVLYYNKMNSGFSRAIQILKVRGSMHSQKLHPYKIDEHGITIYPKEEAFTK